MLDKYMMKNEKGLSNTRLFELYAPGGHQQSFFCSSQNAYLSSSMCTPRLLMGVHFASVFSSEECSIDWTVPISLATTEENQAISMEDQKDYKKQI